MDYGLLSSRIIASCLCSVSFHLLRLRRPLRALGAPIVIDFVALEEHVVEAQFGGEAAHVL